MEDDLVITIDGPAGAGKSTAARLLAKKLGLKYLDTGATYRAVAWKVKKEGIGDDEEELYRLCKGIKISFIEEGEKERVICEGEDITEAIREQEVGMAASFLSQRREVREALMEIQRELAKGGAVAEGRDMGTVVFPDAAVKFYLDAQVQERAKRRYKELKERGMEVEMASVLEEIRRRDEQDTKREIAPLRVPEGAVYIDSTGMTPEEVVQRMLEVIRERGWR